MNGLSFQTCACASHGAGSNSGQHGSCSELWHDMDRVPKVNKPRQGQLPGEAPTKIPGRFEARKPPFAACRFRRTQMSHRPPTAHAVRRQEFQPLIWSMPCNVAWQPLTFRANRMSKTMKNTFGWPQIAGRAFAYNGQKGRDRSTQLPRRPYSRQLRPSRRSL